jgi:hypothetical protein
MYIVSDLRYTLKAKAHGKPCKCSRSADNSQQIHLQVPNTRKNNFAKGPALLAIVNEEALVKKVLGHTSHLALEGQKTRGQKGAAKFPALGSPYHHSD